MWPDPIPAMQPCNHLLQFLMLQHIQKVKSLHRKALQRATPHHLKTSKFALAPHGLKAGKMSGNLFEWRTDWPIPPTNNTATATISKPPIKIEPQAQSRPTPSTTAPPKAEWSGWGPNCPICKNIEDWGQWPSKSNSNRVVHSHSSPRHKAFSAPRPRIIKSPRPSSTPDHRHLMILDRYSNQLKFCRDWKEKMERLNNQIWSWLPLWLWTWLRMRWRRRIQIWTQIRNAHLNCWSLSTLDIKWLNVQKHVFHSILQVLMVEYFNLRFIYI